MMKVILLLVRGCRSGGYTEDFSFVQLGHFLWLQMINRLLYDKWPTQELLCVCVWGGRPTPQSSRTGLALSYLTPHGFTQLTQFSLSLPLPTHTQSLQCETEIASVI